MGGSFVLWRRAAAGQARTIAMSVNCLPCSVTRLIFLVRLALDGDFILKKIAIHPRSMLFILFLVFCFFSLDRLSSFNNFPVFVFPGDFKDELCREEWTDEIKETRVGRHLRLVALLACSWLVDSFIVCCCSYVRIAKVGRCR